MHTGHLPRRPGRGAFFAAAAALLVAVWLAALFVLIIPRERAATVRHWHDALTALARERANALVRRIAEAEGDAALVSRFPTTRLLLGGAADPANVLPVQTGSRAHLEGLLDELRTTQGYSGAYLVAAPGGPSGAEVAVGEPCGDVCRSLASRAIGSGRAMADMEANGHGVSVLFATTVQAPDGRDIGAVVLRHRAESWLIPLLGRNPLGTGGLVTTLAWRSPGGDIGQLQGGVVVTSASGGPSAVDPIVDVLGSGGADFGDLRSARGEAMLAAAVGLGQPAWAVVSAIPRTEALAPFHRSVRDMAAAGSAVVVALLALAFAAWRGLSARHRGEIAQRERQFRAAVDNLAQSFVIYDADRRYVYVNPAGRRMAERSLGDMRGRRGEDVYGPRFAAEFAPTIDRAIATGRRQTIESTLERGGRVVSLVTDYVPVVDSRGNIEQVLGISHDVTDLVRARKELEESRRQLSTLFSNLPGMAYRCRLGGGSSMLLVSEGCRALTGWEPEAFLDGWLSYESLIADEDRDEVQRTVRSQVEAGHPFELVYRMIARDGAVRWVWEKGRGVPDGRDGVVLEGFVSDITPLHVAEARNELLATVVRQSSEIVVITDPEGVIEYVNPAFEAVTGWSEAEALGQHTRMLKSGVHPDSFYAGMWRTITSGAPWRGRMTNRRRDGSEYEEHVAIFPVRDVDGTIVRFVALKRDVSQEVALEHQLQHAQRLEAVGRLAGGVAHDFNNLLQALIAQISVLRSEPELPVAARDRVKEMHRVVQGGASLTRQLLLFSRREVSHPERLDLNAVVGQAEMLLRRLLPAPIALEMDLCAGLLPVNADRGQLEQVLVNLAVNAADAMPDGGTLSITSRRNNDGTVGLEVRDTGPGVPADIRDRIFEPFFTTKGAGAGTGLGLSVVHGIVTRHGGRISVHCPEDGGAAFRIAFPWSASGEFQAIHGADSDAEPAGGDGERVLVVEDEAAAREGLVAGLDLLGFRPVGVGTAADAEALPVGEPFHLLLADLVLPDRNGAELAGRLSRRWPSMAVVLMSGYTEDMAVRLGVRDGNVRFLQKPFGFDDLARELRRALDEAPSHATGSSE